MRTRILAATLVLALVSALSGGGTAAWLTAAAPVPHNELTAGTVLIEAANAGGNQVIEDWEPGECREVSYDVTSTGSKCTFLRASYEGMWYVSDLEFQETGSAWGEGTDYCTGIAQYFSYQLGSGPTEFALRQGADRLLVGNITMDDDDVIRVTYATDAPYVMSEAHLYAGLEEPHHCQVGRLGFTYEPEGCFDTYTFELDRIYSEQMPSTGPRQEPDVYVSALATNTTIYIAAHAVVGTCGGTGEWQEWDQADPAEGGLLQVTPCDESWRMGTDGYLYYVGQDLCLEGVQSGQTVTLCLNVCLDDYADPTYSDMPFRLLLTFEAIQCSNDAAHHLGWDLTCVTGSGTPTGGYFTAKAQANALLHTGVWSRQAGHLLVSTEDASLGESDHGPDTLLYGIHLENTGPRDITIDRMIVRWTSGQLEEGEQNGATGSVSGNWTADAPEPANILAVIVSAEDTGVVWGGHEPSGTRLNISDYLLRPGQTVGMELLFDSSMAGSDLAIAFIMSDGSSTSVSMGPLTGSAVALCPDEVLLDEEDEPEAETEADTETTGESETGEQDGGTGTCDDCGGGEADPVEENGAGDETDSPGDGQQTDGGDEASGDTDGDSVSTEPEADEEDAAGNGEEDGSAGDGDDAVAEEAGETEDGSTGESHADPVDEEDSTSGDTDADSEEGASEDDAGGSSADEPEADHDEGATEDDGNSTSGDTEAESEEGVTGDDPADSTADEPEAGQEEGVMEEEEDSTSEDTEANSEEGATEDDAADSAAEEPEAGQQEGTRDEVDDSIVDEDQPSASGDPETNQDDH